MLKTLEGMESENRTSHVGLRWLWVKNPPAMQEMKVDVDSIPELGRSPGGGHGNPFQYSCLENPNGKGAWWAIVHRVSGLK